MPQVIEIYGLLVDVDRLALAVAVFAALLLMRRLAVRYALEPGRVERIGIAILVGGAVGARAAFVVAQWPAYRDAPWSILYFWQDGYYAPAGVLGGVFVAAVVFAIQRLRRTRPYVVPAVLGLAGPFALLIAVEVFPAALMAASDGQLVAGNAAPTLRMEDLAGRPVSLAELRGHPVIVNVWATWCPPCRREIPMLNRAYRAHRGEGLRMIGVNRGETRDRIGAFLQSQSIDYDVWVDPAAPSGAAAPSAGLLDRAGSPGLPTTLFIDAGGTVRAVKIGELRRGTLLQGLQQILYRETTASR